MASTFILKPYERRRDPGIFGKLVRAALLIFIAAFYGLLCSILPMQLLVVPVVPILFLVGLILWMLPDVGGIYTATMSKLLVGYAFLNLVWPFYVAIDVPGVPWVTPQRICVGLLVATFMFNLAKSSEFRGALADTLAASPLTRRVFWGFCALTALSIPFSETVGFSLNKFINNQIFWTMMFVVSAYLATQPGFVSRVTRAMVIGVLIVAMAGLLESHLQRVIWMDHLPRFLQVDPGLLETFAKSQSRAGTDVYRVRGTMGVSLYYAEYLSMTLPLVIHYAVREKRFALKLPLIAGALAIALNMFLTNARSGMVGLLGSLVLYTLFSVYRLRKRDPGSLTASTLVYGSPAGVLVLFGLVLSSNRMRAMTLGGAQHRNSSEAREAQWAMGIPKVFDHPLGHGVGRANEVLGYTNLGGYGTIDSYYLSLLLEYGPLGFAAFMIMFGSIAWFGFKTFNAAANDDQDMAGPLGIGILNFLVIKGVLSSEINIPIAFMMTGFIVGLMWQQSHAPASATAPAPARPARGRLRGTPQPA